MKLNGSDIIAEVLLEQGVDTIFGYPGGAVLNIYDALYRDGTLRHVLTAHEQGAAHAADGYATPTIAGGTVDVNNKNKTVVKFDKEKTNDVAYTNTRNAVSPTGLAMNVAPYALLVVVAAAGCFVFLRKRREDD